MKTIKISAPAKINLNLKIKGIREDGFHELESVMQTISLYDYITIEKNLEGKINLNGTKADILAYDKTNIAYKGAKLFFEKTGISEGVNIFIEKNIPTQAGLGGGSSDGAGVLYGLNKMFDEPLTKEELLKLCEKLGSDLNFCLIGGRALVRGRGEHVSKLPFEPFSLSIVKPKNLGISTPLAYKSFDELDKISDFSNDLEFAIIDKYETIKYLHNLGLSMSGSGSAFYKIGDELPKLDTNEFEIYRNLEAIPDGVREIS